MDKFFTGRDGNVHNMGNPSAAFNTLDSLFYHASKTMQGFMTNYPMEGVHNLLFNNVLFMSKHDEYLAPLLLHILSRDGVDIPVQFMYNVGDCTGMKIAGESSIELLEFLQNTLEFEEFSTYLRFKAQVDIQYDAMSYDYLIGAFCTRWRHVNMQVCLNVTKQGLYNYIPDALLNLYKQLDITILTQLSTFVKDTNELAVEILGER